jgi:hypothetical protein
VVYVSRESVDGPHLVSHRIVGGPSASLVEIRYSEAMSSSVLSDQNYVIESPRRVLTITGLASDLSAVQVHLDPRYPVGALDLPARLMLRNLANVSGVPMDTSGGRADLILGGAAQGISDIFVYPNPYRGSGRNGEPVITFAGLPEHATIRIFTLQGTLVKTIEHSNGSGAAPWNLLNNHGEAVAAGVYLFSAESNGETNRGKFAILH